MGFLYFRAWAVLACLVLIAAWGATLAQRRWGQLGVVVGWIVATSALIVIQSIREHYQLFFGTDTMDYDHTFWGHFPYIGNAIFIWLLACGSAIVCVLLWTRFTKRRSRLIDTTVGSVAFLMVPVAHEIYSFLRAA